MNKIEKQIIGLHLGINKFYLKNSDSPNIFITAVVFSLYFFQIVFILILLAEIIIKIKIIEPILVNKNNIIIFILIIATIKFTIIKSIIRKNTISENEYTIAKDEIILFEKYFRIFFLFLLALIVILIILKSMF